jgi:hypothetical protein
MKASVAKQTQMLREKPTLLCLHNEKLLYWLEDPEVPM